MANFGEQRRDPSDDFKAAAYEAAQLKRSKNAKELNEKERPVRSGRETLEDANKEASTTLEKFKGTKEEKEKIKKNFSDLMKESIFRDYVVGLIEEGKEKANDVKEEVIEPKKEYKNEKERKKAEDDQLFKDYMKFVGVGKDTTELLKEYGEADERYKSLGKELKSGVRGRKKAKEELLNAIKENNPEQEYGTYKSLEKEALKQVNSGPESIAGKEIRKYVDGLVEKFKDKIPEVVSKFSKNPYGSKYDYKDLFSDEDVIALQKYGTSGYGREAEEYFLQKIQEEVKANLEKEGGESNMSKENIEKRLSTVVNESWKDVSRKVSDKNNDMEKILSMKQEMEKFEKMTPEVEKAFSDFEKDADLGSNMYTEFIQRIRNDSTYGIIVELNVGKDNTPEQKYLNIEQPDSREPKGVKHEGVLYIKTVERNLAQLGDDLVLEKKALGAYEKKQGSYNSFLKRLGKGSEIAFINKEVEKQTKLVKEMEEAQKMLAGMKNFMENIDKIQKDNNREMYTGEVQFDRLKKGFGFKDAIMESLKNRLGQG